MLPGNLFSCSSILFFFLFSRRLAAVARHLGVVASRRGWGTDFSFSLLRRLAAAARHQGVVASRRGAGGERGRPLYTPYDPLHPLVRVAEGGPVVCRIPCPPLAAGAVGAHLPASRAICAPAAALPRCGDRLRAPARWADGHFPGIRVARRGGPSVEKFSHAW